MTDKLPANLLNLFQARPSLRYLPPADKAPEDRTTARIDGVASFVPALKEKVEADKDNDAAATDALQTVREKKVDDRKEYSQWLKTQGYKDLYKPFDDPNIRGNEYKTLFVSRLSYDTVTADLQKEFRKFGPIERVRIVTDKAGKSRGYGFILFEKEHDLKAAIAAYKECNNMMIRGRAVVVDVERGRTIQNWRPRRFGGGLGGRHYTKAAIGRPVGFGPPAGPGGPRGGFRGGFGGGFRGGRGSFGSRGGRPGFGGGYGGAPDGAPAGPRSGGGFGGGYGGGGSRGFDDRSRANPNYDSVPPRGNRDSYRDRDRDGDRYSNSNKRSYDGGYDDSRSRRRY